MMTGLLALFLLLPSNSHATALSVMENTRVSKNAIFVSTQSKNGFIGLGISTQSYNGAVPSVGLYSSSNVVVSNTPSDNCVIYATGSVTCISFVGDGSKITGVTTTGAMLVNSTDTVSGAKTFLSTTTVGVSSYTLSLNYAAVLRGGFSVVGATRTWATTSTTFSNFNANYIHQVHFRCGLRSITTAPFVRFNGDSGSNYGWHYVENTSAGGAGSNASNSGTEIDLGNTLSGSNPAQIWNGSFEIAADTGTLASAQLWGQSVGDDGSGGTARAKPAEVGGTYIGASQITSFSFQNAGAMDCLLYVLALVPPLNP